MYQYLDGPLLVNKHCQVDKDKPRSAGLLGLGPGGLTLLANRSEGETEV